MTTQSPNQSDAPKPTHLRLDRKNQTLEVHWPEGRQDLISAAMLRKNCPCATCRTDRQRRETETLPILSKPPAQDLRCTGAALVGNYALQLIWSDGHQSGIYDFRFLRDLGDTQDPSTLKP